LRHSSNSTETGGKGLRLDHWLIQHSFYVTGNGTRSL